MLRPLSLRSAHMKKKSVAEDKHVRMKPPIYAAFVPESGDKWKIIFKEKTKHYSY